MMKSQKHAQCINEHRDKQTTLHNTLSWQTKTGKVGKKNFYEFSTISYPGILRSSLKLRKFSVSHTAYINTVINSNISNKIQRNARQFQPNR